MSGSALGEPNAPDINNQTVQPPVVSDPESATNGNLNDDQWLRTSALKTSVKSLKQPKTSNWLSKIFKIGKIESTPPTICRSSV